MESYTNSPVLIFGGGFNPPTLAHQEIINACLGLPDFTEVWVMPSGNRFDKQMNVDDSDRLEMLNLIKQYEFNNNSRLKISDFELHLPRPTQTYKTVAALKALHSNIDFWFTFGADSYQGMPNWDRGLELQSSLNMVIFERGNTDMPQREDIIKLRLNDHNGLSSTEARIAACDNRPLEGFVCQSVKRYIEKRNLYRTMVQKKS